MDPLSITTGVTALMGVVMTVMQCLVDIRDSDKERDKLWLEITSLLTFLQSIRSSADAGIDQRWYENYRKLGEEDGPLDQMRLNIEELLTLVQPPASKLKSIGNKVAWQFEKANVYKLIERINRLKADIGLALGRDQFNLTLQIQNETAETNQNVQVLRNADLDREKAEIAAWLSPLDFRSHHVEISADRAPETGLWFVQNEIFQEWRNPSDHDSKGLFCPGIPGAGKTLLASSVIDQLRISDSPVLFLYFDYKGSTTQTRPNIIAALLRQLCEIDAPTTTPIRRLYEAHKDRGTRPPNETLEKVLIDSLGGSRRNYIVVDALDEAAEDVRSAILELFQVLQRQKTTNVLITSRPMDMSLYFETNKILCDRCDREVWGSFCHCSTCDEGNYDLCLDCYDRGLRCLDEKHELERQATIASLPISADQSDVQRFIKFRIQQSSRLKRCVQKQPKLEDKIIETVNDRYHGMFLPAKLLLDVLKDKASPAAVSRALDTMANGSLDSIYGSALDRIRQQGEYDWDLASRLLQWVVHSYRPLTVPEMQHALATGESTTFDEDEIVDGDLLVNICAGLVEVVDGCFHLVHKTAQEYFEQISGDVFPHPHRQLTTCCLKYLTLDDFEGGPCEVTGEGDAFYDRLENYPFYSYAAQCWGAHFATATPVSEELIGMAVDFLEVEQRREAAIQAMWYLNAAWDVKGGLTGLHIASFFGLPEVAKELLNHDAAVDAQDSMLNTPLIYAAKSGSAETVSILLTAGASPNLCDGAGSNALLHAVTNSHQAVVAALLQASEVDVNYINKTWHASNALMLSCSKGNHQIVHLLLQRPELGLNFENYLGRTALWLAACNGHLLIVQDLLTREGLDAKHASTSTGYSALHVAANRGFEAVVAALLTADIPIDIRDRSGGTPLMRACDNGHMVIIMLLIERGADINARDDVGRTILHSAAINGHHRVVRKLLEVGLDPNVKGNSQETPLDDCTHRKSPAHATAADVLLEYGAVANVAKNDGWQRPSEETDSKGPDVKGPDFKKADIEGPDSQGPDSNVPDSNVPDPPKVPLVDIPDMVEDVGSSPERHIKSIEPPARDEESPPPPPYTLQG